MTTAYRLLPALALFAAGCASLPPPYQATPGTLVLPQLVVFQDSTGPLSYNAPTAERLPRPLQVAQIEGRACQSGVQIPFGYFTGFAENNGDQAAAVGALSAGWGDGGYARAMEEALKNARVRGLGGQLYDIRADVNVIQILGIWRQQCLVITASVPVGERQEGSSPGQ